MSEHGENQYRTLILKPRLLNDDNKITCQSIAKVDLS